AGTGLSGGSLAVDGALTVSLDRMTAVSVDPTTRVAVVEPGALNAAVKAAARAHGLHYPPDPSSYEICSIGGNLATNAGGLCCVKYGVTTDYVLGLDVVLADGTLVRLGGQTIKDVAGLALMKLFVGSEGTLGVIVGATLRLIPEPSAAATLVASFPTTSAAADAVVSMGSRLRPSLVEFMDNYAINAVEDLRAMGLDRRAGALLLVQCDSPGTARDTEIAAVEALSLAAGATEVYTSSDPDEGEQFLAARRAALPALERRGAMLLEDVGVPVPKLPALLARIEEISAIHGLPIPVVAHAGDGNTHPNVIYNPSEPGALDRAERAFADVMQAAIALGGTISGEHGVGRLKRAALPDQLGAAVMDLTWRVKNALDPDGILNPGAILDPVNRPLPKEQP
ncbi:MAG: FAD-linked oxidase C-terminal domain-containing protein, partial [Nostocoides sp.]